MASPKMLVFAGLYLLLFGALGAEIAFLPNVLATAGLSPGQVGLVLSVGTVAQVLVAPVAGNIADRRGVRVVMLAAALVAAGSLLLLPVLAGSIVPAMLVYLLFAMAIAPLNPLADAITVPACRQMGVPYGRVRGAGSVGFLVGVLLSSAVAARAGAAGPILTAAVLFAALTMVLPALPDLLRREHEDHAAGAVGALLRIRAYRRVLVVAAMVIGSHAMSDAFAVIYWQANGLVMQTIGIMLAVAVVSEILVFVAIGPFLLRTFGPASCAAIGAVAGAIRWAVLAETQSLWLALLTQVLHGLTFSLVHLACMQALATIAPRNVFATAQSLYSVFANAIASAVITLVAGSLFGAMHGHAFLLASLLSLLAVPLALRLNEREPAGARA